jgi:predicted phosphodiesterase
MPQVRIALISDLHGNALALDHVLSRIARRGVDVTVCLGDVATLGPEPERAVELLQGSGAICILGNHDEFMLRPELVAEYTNIAVLREAIDWCRTRLSRAALDFIKGFRASHELPLGNGELLLAFHGTPASNTTDLLSTTDAGDIDVWIEGTTARVLVGGHTHLQMLRQHRGRLLVNPGSVGMPFREYVAGGPPEVMPEAEFAVIDSDSTSVNVSLERVALDRAALRQSVLAVDYPMAVFLARSYA